METGYCIYHIAASSNSELELNLDIQASEIFMSTVYNNMVHINNQLLGSAAAFRLSLQINLE